VIGDGFEAMGPNVYINRHSSTEISILMVIFQPKSQR